MTRRERVERGAAAASVTLAAACAAGTVLALAGGLWWPLDLFAHFPLQYALGLAVALAALAALRRWRWAAAAAPFLVWNAALVAGLYLGGPAPAMPGAPVVEVISFNVEAGNPHHDDIVAYLRAADPDVAVLFEVRPALLDALRAAFPDRHVVAEARRDNFGIAAVVRGPIARASIVTLVPDGYPSVEVVVDRGGHAFAILGVHAPPPLGGAWAGVRDRTLAAAGAWAKGSAEPATVVGDFNATPWSSGFDAVVAPGGLVSAHEGRGFAPTWPSAPWPLALPIDHCVHDRRLTAVSRRRGPRLGSDHRALEVSIAPAAGR